MSDNILNGALSFLLIVLLGIIIFMGVALVQNNDDSAKAVVAPKVGSFSKYTVVRKTFNKNFTGIRRAYNEVGWAFGDVFQDEESLLAHFEINTAAERKTFFTNMIKSGGKRVRKTCYNLYSSDHSWALGYCINVEAPLKIKEKA